MTMRANQKLGVARPMMARGAPRVVGSRILAYRRVDAHWQGYHEPDRDCQDTQLDGYRQSGHYPFFYRNNANH